MKGQYLNFSPSKGDFRFAGKEGGWLYKTYFTVKKWEDLLVQFKEEEG